MGMRVINKTVGSMKLKTRIFELCNGKYPNLVELAQTMEISQDLIYRVRKSERGVHEKFIMGVLLL